MTLHALVTRPEEDAAPLAAALAERGVEVTVEPLLTIRPIADATVDLDGVQALLFTSANGVRSFAALATARGLAGWRDLPAFAVGDASAAAARETGVTRVESAGGDVAALARRVIDRLDPKAGALFHAAGSAVAGDLAGLLGAAGFSLRREMLYEAKPADQLSPATATALANRAFDLVLFFSPRTATTFATLTRAAGDGVVSGCASAVALCLSPAVAAEVRALPWREIQAAARPELPAVLDLIDRELAARARSDSADAVRGSPTPGSGDATALLQPTVANGTAPPARGKRSPWWSVVAVAAIVSLAVALIDYGGRLVLTGGTEILAPDYASSEEVRQLRSQLADLETELGALRQHFDNLRGDLVDGRNRIAALESAPRNAQAASPDLDQLTERLDRIESEIAALRTAGPAPDVPSANVTTVTNELAALTEKVETLESRLASQQALAPTSVAVNTAEIEKLRRENAQLRDDLGAMRAKLDALDEAMSARRADAGGVAFVLAVGNLGSALATARPFAAELGAVTELAADDPALSAQVKEVAAPLANHATIGVPTLVDLRTRFAAVARTIVDEAKRQEAPPAEQPDGREWYDTPLAWLSSAGEFLTSQVSVRPVGDVAGDDPGARVARAEVRLSEGALAAAVAELEALTGPAAMAAAPWLGDARARLAADRAVAALQSAAITRLGAPPATDAGG